MASTKENPGCLNALFELLGLAPKQPRAMFYPYKIRDNFLSPAEMQFYQSLIVVVKRNAVICPKVRLSDVFIPHQTEQFQRFNNYLMQKHIDFLLCEPTSMRPMLGIELDDKSHERPKRQERDEFIDKLYAAAELPLVHVKVQAVYDIVTLTQQVAQHIPAMMPTIPSLSSAPTPEEHLAYLTANAPLCPKHGVRMEVKMAQHGERKGKRFYGCPKYPDCREIINIDP